MKKLFYLIIVFIMLSGCESTRFFTSDTYMLDFRPYAAEGFLMTTGSITVPYSPIGEIRIDCHEGYDSGDSQHISSRAEDYTYIKLKRGVMPVRCDINDLLDQIYFKAKDNGANALINLSINAESDFEKMQRFDHVVVTGLAIKLE